MSWASETGGTHIQATSTACSADRQSRSALRRHRTFTIISPILRMLPAIQLVPWTLICLAVKVCAAAQHPRRKHRLRTSEAALREVESFVSKVRVVINWNPTNTNEATMAIPPMISASKAYSCSFSFTAIPLIVAHIATNIPASPTAPTSSAPGAANLIHRPNRTRAVNSMASSAP